MKLYYCEVNWYDEYCDREDTSSCFIFAHTYADACDQLDPHFTYIKKVNIEEVNDDTANATVLFVEKNNEALVQSIKNSNSY